MKLKDREKILIIFASIAIAIWAFDRFYYAPQSQKILKFKEEIKTADQKMEQFLLLTKSVETVGAEVARMEKDLKGLSERTLKGEEFRAFLKHLARETDSLQMKIISLTPQEEELSSPVGIESGSTRSYRTDSRQEGKKVPATFQYKKVNLQMGLHSTYANLGTYLNEIEKLPFLLNVDSLQIERSDEVLPFLKVTMGLSMYKVEGF
jgi:Tfp pilus assembly protein PilO